MLSNFRIVAVFFIFFCIGNLFPQIAESYEYSSPPSQTPTYGNIVKPHNVLVVFKKNDSASDSIVNYYVNKRGIPSINVINGTDGFPGLDIPDTATYSGLRVILSQDGEVIKRDNVCSDYNMNGVCDTLAWHYYNEK